MRKPVWWAWNKDPLILTLLWGSDQRSSLLDPQRSIRSPCLMSFLGSRLVLNINTIFFIVTLSGIEVGLEPPFRSKPAY
jgi:hypothetical protein